MIDIEGTIKALLHAHRDTLRNLDKDTRMISFDCREGYYGEAFGILRGLEILGYGYFGSSNQNGLEDNNGTMGLQKEHNLSWWFCQLENEVLEEEEYYSKTGICTYCRDRFGKDDLTIKRRISYENI